jgi:hypothetical protein
LKTGKMTEISRVGGLLANGFTVSKRYSFIVTSAQSFQNMGDGLREIDSRPRIGPEQVRGYASPSRGSPR